MALGYGDASGSRDGEGDARQGYYTEVWMFTKSLERYGSFIGGLRANGLTNKATVK